MSSRTHVLVISACLALVASVAQAKIIKTIQVDCTKGESVNAALEDKAEELIVEISGICMEDVEVRRDRVTLRGVEPGATIIGTQTPAVDFTGAITVYGSSGVVITDLLVRDSRRGVVITDGAAAYLERVVVQDNLRTGIRVHGSSFARLTDCTAERNLWGIAVWGNSELELRGTTIASGNRVAGLVLSASNASGSGLTQRIEANDNVFGVFLQIGATAQPVNLVASGNNYGLFMLIGGAFAGGLEATGNDFGVYLVTGASCELGGTLTGNGIAIYSEHESALTFSGEVTGNATGMVLDGSEAVFSNATVTDHVSLAFGTRVDFAGGNSFGSLDCDETVLTRGDVSCPAPLAGRGIAGGVGPQSGLGRPAVLVMKDAV